MTTKRRMRYTKHLLWAWPLVLLVTIFWEPITTSRTLFHPDWAPYFTGGKDWGFYEVFIGIGWTPSFMNLLRALLPDRFFHIFFYFFCVMGIVLSTFGFLREQKLPTAASFAGALAIGFSGYMFTLVSAGHRGVFEVMLTSTITLFCVKRGLRTGELWCFLVTAIVTAFSLGGQPDVLVMIGLFLAAYTLVAGWHSWNEIRQKWRRMLLGLLAGSIAFAIASPPAFSTIINGYLPNRAAKDAPALSKAATTAQSSTGIEAQQDAKWEFCTNWSLPPRDALEFGVPLLFGTETSDRDAPFWGELGRSMGWRPGQPGFRNFRQHTVYIGGVQIVLAFYALVVLGLRRKRRLDGRLESWPIWFWASAAAVSTLLAFGRYTPLYRLFYAIPLADTVRCPVKFLHVTNIAVAILAAYGMALFMHRQAGRRNGSKDIGILPERITAIGCAAAIGTLILASLLIKTGREALITHWLQQAYPAELHPAMMDRLLTSLTHAGLVLAVPTGLLSLIAFRKAAYIAPGLAAALLCIVIGSDMAVVGKHFVNTLDLSVHESRNDAVLDIQAPVPPRLFDALTSRGDHEPLRVNLMRYYEDKVRLLDRDLTKFPEILRQAGGNIDALTKVFTATGTEYVLGKRDQMLQLAQHPRYAVFAHYDFNRRIAHAINPQRAPITLLRVSDVLPRMALATRVRPVASEAEATRLLTTGDWNPWESVLLAQSDIPDEWQDTPTPRSLQPIPLDKQTRYSASFKVSSHTPAIVLFNEPYNDKWRARLNGTETDILKANAYMMAVVVPAGEHIVEFKHEPGKRHFWLAVVPSYALLILAVLGRPFSKITAHSLRAC